MSNTWLALVIGNSRLHWAQFVDHQLHASWNSPHLSSQSIQIPLQPPSRLPTPDSRPPDLWIASVVPSQTQFWKVTPNTHFITLEQIPLKETYPTLGIDRALALWGAIQTVGSPVLVIDAGTALTFTGADTQNRLIGGAILPGLQLQFHSLGQSTAALPSLPTSDSRLPTPVPSRWSRNTEDAIASGVIHTLLAGIQSFIEDWWQQFPGSAIVLTGGDGEFLYQCLQQRSLELTSKLLLNPNVIFEGIQAIRDIKKG